ncbi:MAG: hypothetical protein HUU37_00395 [Bdellovibrionales bacterium]|nr:hypothetical protein [Bdellovibrionales bacterium]
MNRIIILTAIISAVLTAPSHAAGGSDGTRGGGEAVRHEGQLRLRDLVDPSVCDYKTGEELRDENPTLTAELSRLAAVDWYLAAGIKKEIDLLEICLTDQLVKIPSQDYDSVIRWGRHHAEQAAVRFLDSRDVYLNKRIYDSLPAADKAYLLVHEAIHSFIPWDTGRRNEKVRAAVAAIHRAAQGRTPSRDRLFADLDRSSVQYPATSPSLANQRTAIEFALSSLQEKKSTLRETKNVDGLFVPSKFHKDVAENLHVIHGAIVLGDPAGMMSELMAGDMETTIRLLNGPEVTSFDPLLTALSLPDAANDPAFQKAILESGALQRGPSLFGRMKNKRLVVRDLRIRGMDGFHLLGVSEGGPEATALSVRPLTVGESRLAPRETIGLIRLIAFFAKQAKNGNEFGRNTVQALLSRNGGFYPAFEVKTLLGQLEALSPPVAREKDHLRESIPELVRGFRVVLRHEVGAAVDAETADAIDREIDWNALTN